MRVADISGINFKLVGISYLKDKEGKLLKELWMSRFSEQTAFFLEVDESDSTRDIIRKLSDKIKAFGYTTMVGMNVIMVMFLDITSPMEKDSLQILEKVPDKFQEHMGCTISLNQYFGFTGIKEPEKVELIRKNIVSVIGSQPFLNGLYLVAEPEFGGDEEARRWKAVTVFLDLIRRHSDPQQLLNVTHNKGTIAYLGYDEYDESLLNRLQTERDELTRNLTANGDAQFRTNLNALLNGLENEIKEKFVVNGAMQPVHTEMTVTGFWARGKARRGNNDEYNRAMQQTVAAVCDTGERLEKKIVEFALAHVGDPKDFLIHMLEEIGVGFPFVENRVAVKDYFSTNIPTVQRPMLQSIPYNESGLYQEISDYLNGVVMYAVSVAKRAVIKALKQAYDNFSDEEIVKKKIKMKERLDIIKINMNHVPQKKEFCNIALGSGQGLHFQFRAVTGDARDRTVKFLLCRTKEDEEWLKTNLAETYEECAYYIDETFGGIGQLDHAPIKAVHCMLFDGTESRIEELISAE